MPALPRIPSRHRPLPRPALLAAAAGLLWLSSCGESSVTDPYQEAAGVFLLQSIAGAQLPAVITSSPTEGVVLVTTGSLFLSPDRRFQETLTITLEPPGGADPQNGAAVATGTYTVAGDSVEFSIDALGSTPASTMQATLRGDTLSYSVFGRVVLYVKL
jgi:D-serine deaminase-like pyridoxal phosphate-dependent protein